MRIAFIITSVINTIATELTYGVRSYYSMNDRFNQTLQTINSIKYYVPTADIYLIEGSNIPHKMEFILESLVKNYSNIHINSELRKGIESKLKGYGESNQIYYAINKYDMSKYDYIFKISGRYYLSDNFNLDNLIGYNNIVFCKGKKPPPIVSTVLYMIPNKDINLIKLSYNMIIRLYTEYGEKNILDNKEALHYEYIVPKILGDYTVIDKIGVKGLVSSYKAIYEC